MSALRGILFSGNPSEYHEHFTLYSPEVVDPLSLARLSGKEMKIFVDIRCLKQ